MRTNSSAAIDADVGILSAFIRAIRVIRDSEQHTPESRIAQMTRVWFRIADSTDDADKHG